MKFDAWRGGLLAGSIVIGLLGLNAAREWWTKRNTRRSAAVEQSQRAYLAGDWAAAERLARKALEEETGRDAHRVLKRSIARQDRPIEALASYRQFGVAGLEAEDFGLIGRAYSRIEGSESLAWLALDTARRLDPRNRETIRQLAKMEQRRSQLGDAGEIMDRAGVLTSKTDRAVLLLGLDMSPRPSTSVLEDAILRSLVEIRVPRGRELGPRDARRLLSRVLLRLGHPDAIERELDEILGGTVDEYGENWWLASRAALQRKDKERAKEGFTFAGGFTESQTNPSEPSPYVGSAACRACHASVHERHQRSRHSRSLPELSEVVALGLPDGPVPDSGDPNVTHRVAMEKDLLVVETRVADGDVRRAIVDYAFGSGRRGVTLVGRDSSGAHRELRVSYYTEGPKWDRTTGHPVVATLPDEWLGRTLSWSLLKSCFSCHSTTTRGIRDTSVPEAFDRGIGCERCHGPGLHHVRSAEMELVSEDPAIALPAGALAGSLGERTSTRFQAIDLARSRCYDPESPALSCVTCHDPHRDIEESPDFYVAKCLNCHGAQTEASVRVRPGPPCPVNATTGCISCHMPASAKGTAHTTFVDHWIRRRPEAAP
jgi:hypothetical protein